MKRASLSRLAGHPNIRLPALPRGVADNPETQSAVRWALECAAAFVSPPKEDGEDEEFRCDDVAKALTGVLWPGLRDKLER